ncbi:MAG: DNA polymerase III subunit delta [Bifidobacteriaceae bacterium]|jgi:DNA polymerase-3 subunit delta|nr:DNA polymerase III subunit delta [Bifidobacteriaceae bacterium]
MAQAASSATNVASLTVVFGGDEYLNSRTLKALQQAAVRANPEAEVIEVEASSADSYEFDEAVSPSLLSNAAVVVIPDLQDAAEEFIDAMKVFVKETSGSKSGALADSSVVIAAHDGSMKGKKYVDALKKAGAKVEQVEKLANDRSRLAFVRQEFRRYGRTVQEPAAQQLVAVLGGRTAELAAMCQQLCFDFDENPISLATAMRYLDDAPEVTGFAVADAALEGRAAQAVLKLRQAIKRGMEPLALVGAIASKLRSMGKAAAIQAGKANAAELRMNGWFLTKATQQVRGWSSEGLGACIEALAHADQEAKSSSGDPVFALEQAVELIARRGRPLVA